MQRTMTQRIAIEKMSPMEKNLLVESTTLEVICNVKDKVFRSLNT